MPANVLVPTGPEDGRGVGEATVTGIERFSTAASSVPSEAIVTSTRGVEVGVGRAVGVGGTAVYVGAGVGAVGTTEVTVGDESLLLPIKK
jgi:hypothetical protein